MKAEIVNVTPQTASDWLKFNTDNRPLRRTVVDGFKSAILRGEYIPTHQGIAFSDDGVLLDGQHRLTAISELRDGAYPMLVTWGVSKDAFKVMDIGVKRNAADALKEDKRLVEAGRLIAKCCAEGRGSMSPTMLIPYLRIIEDRHTDLIAFCPTSVRTWSSAPIRVAAIASAQIGVDWDYVKHIYATLTRQDLNNMPPVARALYKSAINGMVRASAAGDLMARCMVVFNPSKADNTKIQIGSSVSGYTIMRDIFAAPVAEYIEGQKKAAPIGAARNVSMFEYSRNTAKAG